MLLMLCEATAEVQAEVGGPPRLMLLPAVHGEKYVSAAQLLKMSVTSLISPLTSNESSNVIATYVSMHTCKRVSR